MGLGIWQQDGVEVDNSTTIAFFNTVLDIDSMNIGRNVDSSGGQWEFDGTMSELQIYNHSLSAEQILALYNNRTDLIVSQETSVGEVWRVEVTPTNGSLDGVSVQSNNLTILNTIPTIDQVILNSSLVNNLTSDNLTAFAINVTDANNDPVKLIYDWIKDNRSITVLNMPFEGGSNATFTKDYDTPQNNGTVTGPTFNVTGGYDGFGAYEFDGIDDNMSVGTSPLFEAGATEMSISTWLYTGNASFDGNLQMYVSTASGSAGSNDGFWVGIDDRSGGNPTDGIQLAIATASGAGFLEVSNVINETRWYHIVVTYDGVDTGKVYVDGVDTGTALTV